jgi:hypothetical protein
LAPIFLISTTPSSASFRTYRFVDRKLIPETSAIFSQPELEDDRYNLRAIVADIRIDGPLSQLLQFSFLAKTKQPSFFKPFKGQEPNCYAVNFTS